MDKHSIGVKETEEVVVVVAADTPECAIFITAKAYMVRIGNKLAIVVALRIAAAWLQGTSKRQPTYHVDGWYHHTSR